MKISEIHNISYGKNFALPADSQKQSFNGIWQRCGQNYLDSDRYCAGIFYSFVDGKKLTPCFDKLGRRLFPLESNGLTAKEGKLAWNFLFEGKETMEGFEALRKLRTFMQKKSYAGKHNVMFLEKEDSAVVTAERKRINLAVVNRKILDFADKEGLLPKVKVTPDVEAKNIPMTTEALMKHLSENGVA